MRVSSILLSVAALSPSVLGQLSGSVGPTTTTESKATKLCDVTDYGAKADKTTDLGPALTSAWDACKTGGTVVIPEGDYALSTWVLLKNGKNVAIQLDGVIYRAESATANGNMIMIRDTSDFEMFSSTGKGAMQGLGYLFHKDGNRSNTPRLLRFYKVNDFSIHDISLVDAPLFHFVMDTCTNGEVYNMAVVGADWGGLDGIDVWSNNIWIHDIMVSNKDECVTVKSPSKNILIENIHCNWSGGCAIGSLGLDTAISQIHYRNVYTWKSNQMMMIKDNGGSGYVEDVLFENFIGHGNAYSANIDQYWSSMKSLGSTGAQLSNITYKNWKGTNADGSSRGYLKAVCSDSKPCTDITLTDFAMWTESGSKQVNECRSSWGTGGCLKKGTAASYAATKVTETAKPTAYSAASMPNNFKTGYNTASSIPLPTIPSSFYPGATPIKALARS